MFNKIKTVKPLDNYILYVDFEDGQCKKYDIKPLFDKYKEFTALQTVKGLYALVQVDKGGYGVSWNDELDISCNELYEQGLNADEIQDDEYCIQLLENYNNSADKGEFIPLDDAAKMCGVDI